MAAHLAVDAPVTHWTPYGGASAAREEELFDHVGDGRWWLLERTMHALVPTIARDPNHDCAHRDEMAIENQIGVDQIARRVAPVEAGAETAERQICGLAVGVTMVVVEREATADDRGAHVAPSRQPAIVVRFVHRRGPYTVQLA